MSLAGLSTFAVIVALLWQDLTQKTIAIAPISVPRKLAENGYTADVAAQRLQDALKKVAHDAHAENELEVLQQADLPSIVVPTIGLSLETIASDIRNYFQIDRRRNISGEFTIAQNQLWLRLRMNGQDFFFKSTNGGDPERPDELLAPAAEGELLALAAEKVFEQTDPYIAAASLRDSDPSKSLEIAKQNESKPWAHNLAGIILSHQHKTKEAIAEYRKSPRLAAAHHNLAIILRTQGKTKEAEAEDQKAKELSAKHPD